MRRGTEGGGMHRATRDRRGGGTVPVLRLRAIRGTATARGRRGEESSRGTGIGGVEMLGACVVGRGPRQCVGGWTNENMEKRNGTKSASGTASAGKRTLGETVRARDGGETDRIVLCL